MLCLLGGMKKNSFKFNMGVSGNASGLIKRRASSSDKSFSRRNNSMPRKISKKYETKILRTVLGKKEASILFINFPCFVGHGGLRWCGSCELSSVCDAVLLVHHLDGG